MTGQQQQDLWGIGAHASAGRVIIESEAEIDLDPAAARRFMFYLARAIQDARYRERRNAEATTASARADHDARYRELREAEAIT